MFSTCITFYLMACRTRSRTNCSWSIVRFLLFAGHPRTWHYTPFQSPQQLHLLVSVSWQGGRHDKNCTVSASHVSGVGIDWLGWHAWPGEELIGWWHTGGLGVHSFHGNIDGPARGRDPKDFGVPRRSARGCSPNTHQWPHCHFPSAFHVCVLSLQHCSRCVPPRDA